MIIHIVNNYLLFILLIVVYRLLIFIYYRVIYSNQLHLLADKQI